MRHAARILQMQTLAAAGVTPTRAAEVARLTTAAVYTLAKKHGITFAKSYKAADDRLSELRALAAAGTTRREAAETLGISYVYVVRLALAHDIEFKRKTTEGVDRDPERTQQMASLYQAGNTLEQIGKRFGVTRERVRQILRSRTKVKAKDGGQALQGRRNRIARASARDARYLAKHGCTYAQYSELREIGRAAMANGTSRERTPVGAFQRQKQNAVCWRKIEWNLTLWQWWGVWQESGKWNERGRGQGYVMCRRDHSKPYEVGNVFIALAAENSAENRTKNKGLPRGVRPNRNGPGYIAQRSIEGRKLYLGVHATPELAFAAYLAALPAEARAA
jgi:hypothetical protein